jgi:hypothetical protein
MKKEVPTIEERLKKDYITKGFLSSGESPSQNAVIMYTIYLNSLPENWDIKKEYKPGIQNVRDYFGIDYGFNRMIMWGIDFECSKSKTSNKRYKSMNKAFLMAKSIISMGVFISDKKLKVS